MRSWGFIAAISIFSPSIVLRDSFLMLTASVTRCWNKKQLKIFQMLPKSEPYVIFLKSDAFQKSPKVTEHLGYFWKKL